VSIRVAEGCISFGSRGDGSPWNVNTYVLTGQDPGPRTAVVAGIWGDKPLGVLAAHDLIRSISKLSNLRGTVIVIPAANPAALEIGQRIGPDSLPLNRRFPGNANGFITDQTAFHLTNFLSESCDAVLDLHSGTPTMGLNYTYDFGCEEFSAAFGTLPVILRHTYPNQLSSVMSSKGIISCLAEFGGGRNTSQIEGVNGSLNVLRARGHINESLSGPATVARIIDVDLVLSSSTGLFRHRDDVGVGSPVAKGYIGALINFQTGKAVEEYEVAKDGAIVLMLSSSPMMVSPGSFLYMVGYPDGEIRVPQTGELEFTKSNNT